MINKIACTQYNDWTGGAAFDDADFTSVSAFAKSKGLIGNGDVVYGFEASYSDVTKEVTVTFSYTNMPFDQFKGSGSPLSHQSFTLPVGDFFDLFKRANFAVGKKGL